MEVWIPHGYFSSKPYTYNCDAPYFDEKNKLHITVHGNDYEGNYAITKKIEPTNEYLCMANNNEKKSIEHLRPFPKLYSLLKATKDNQFHENTYETEYDVVDGIKREWLSSPTKRVEAITYPINTGCVEGFTKRDFKLFSRLTFPIDTVALVNQKRSLPQALRLLVFAHKYGNQLMPPLLLQECCEKYKKTEARPNDCSASTYASGRVTITVPQRWPYSSRELTLHRGCKSYLEYKERVKKGFLENVKTVKDLKKKLKMKVSGVPIKVTDNVFYDKHSNLIVKTLKTNTDQTQTFYRHTFSNDLNKHKRQIDK